MLRSRSSAHETRMRFDGRRARALVAIACASFLLGCAQPRASTETPSQPAATAADAELTRFVPGGMQIGASARGDLDGDGDEDALIVVDRPGEATAIEPRGLVLLRRDANGVLREALSNPHAVLCRRCGGMMGDPLQDVRTHRGGFTLRFEGGSRELWSSEFRFEYAQGHDTWRLTGVTHGGLDRADGTTAERRITAKEFGDVALTAFDPEDYPADALP